MRPPRKPNSRYAARALRFRAHIFGTALALLACGGCDGSGKALSPLESEGRGVYMSVCIACHNADPAKEGGLGPPIAGSSLALLEARVVRGEYPPGYQPQRDSSAMPAFPHLADQIEALHAYLEASRGAEADAGS